MTIPIIPGPFSFLAGAGRAVGALKGAADYAQDQRRKNAQDAIRFWDTQIAAGHLPPEFRNQLGYQKALSDAGYGQVAAVPDVATPFASAITGVRMTPRPTGLQAPVRTPMQASATELVEGRRRGAVAAVPAGGPQERALTGVPSREVAAAAEATTIAGGQRAEAEALTAQLNADALVQTLPTHIRAQIAQDRTTFDVFQGARTLLGNKPEMMELAAEAALGILPMRLTQLESNRTYFGLRKEAEAEQLRMLLGFTNQIGDEYRSQITEWNRGLRAKAQMMSLDPDNPKDLQTARDAYSSEVGPEPTYNHVRDEFLMAHGLDLQQFTEMNNAVYNRLYPGSVRKGAGRPTPTADQSANQFIARTVTSLRDAPNTQTIDALFQRHAQGQISEIQLRSVRARSTGFLAANVLAYYDEKLRGLRNQPSGTVK